MNLRNKYYSKPAGVCDDDWETLRLSDEEKALSKFLKDPMPLADKRKKELKGFGMGAKMVLHLLEAGQYPPLILILSLLNWWDVAIVLMFIPGSAMLQALLSDMIEKVFMTNTQFLLGKYT
jgi:hypothetical protein